MPYFKSDVSLLPMKLNEAVRFHSPHQLTGQSTVRSGPAQCLTCSSQAGRACYNVRTSPGAASPQRGLEVQPESKLRKNILKPINNDRIAF